jgi:UDP-glucose 4-epimerase
MRVRQCLVTGGAGFIGSHLVEQLLQREWRVRVLDNFSTGKPANLAGVQHRIELVRGSITDEATAHAAAAGCEVVFHLAALPSVARSLADPLTSHLVCATGTLQVLDAARRAGVRRLIYAASSSAYGGTPGALRKEDDSVAPLSPYAASKLAGEHYCQAFTAVYGLETVRLRFFNVFGPRQDARSPYTGVIALFAAALLEGRVPNVQGDGLQSRDFTYVANAVQALVRAADAPTAIGQVYNIGNGETTTVLGLIHRLNEILGTRLVPDISRARRDLDYKPAVSFVEGLRRTVKALLQENAKSEIRISKSETNPKSESQNPKQNRIPNA